MKKLFSNILVPVDLGNPSGNVIREAMELARTFECNVHLLFMLPPAGRRYTHPGNWFKTEEDINQRILKLYAGYIMHLPPPLLLHTATGKGRHETLITNYAIKHPIDLVVMGRSHPLLSAGWLRQSAFSRLSKRIGCPVLTLHSSASLESLRNIVLPVSRSFLPLRKLMFATYLAKKFNSRLHLITLSPKRPAPADDDNAYLLKAYRLIRDNTEVPVECKTLPGENLATTTLQYARDVKADLIVINPGKESLLSGLLNRLFSRFLFDESRIPVMMVAPPAKS
jgi:nucleotide-binding universal stress UspA family protein